MKNIPICIFSKISNLGVIHVLGCYIECVIQYNVVHIYMYIYIYIYIYIERERERELIYTHKIETIYIYIHINILNI